MNLENTEASVYWHQSRLVTHTERVGTRINTTDNTAVDYGASLHKAFTQAQWLGNVSVLVDARSGVRVNETEQSVVGAVQLQQTTLDARQLNLALVADGQRLLGQGKFVTGARLNWQRQDQDSLHWSDVQASGFVAYAHPLSPSLSANVFAGSAFRTPTLTERFFKGETPRGRIIGNVDLATEHALNVQAQLRFENVRQQVELNLFHQRIDDYIERLIERDTLQYRNLSRADVQGISYQWRYRSGPWQTTLGGQWLRGEDDQSNPVADISPARHDLDVHYRAEPFLFWAGAQWRSAHSRVSPGEIRRPSHVVLRLGGQWEISDRLQLSVQLQNLNNRAFFTSQDEDAPRAQGRDVRVSLSYFF